MHVGHNQDLHLFVLLAIYVYIYLNPGEDGGLGPAFEFPHARAETHKGAPGSSPHRAQRLDVLFALSRLLILALHRGGIRRYPYQLFTIADMPSRANSAQQSPSFNAVTVLGNDGHCPNRAAGPPTSPNRAARSMPGLR